MIYQEIKSTASTEANQVKINTLEAGNRRVDTEDIWEPPIMHVLVAEVVEDSNVVRKYYRGGMCGIYDRRYKKLGWITVREIDRRAIG